MKKKLFFFVTIFMLSSISIANADEGIEKDLSVFSAKEKTTLLGTETVTFLKNNEIDLEEIEMSSFVQKEYENNGMSAKGAYKDIIKSIKRDAETYGFSKEQVKNYIKASMSTVPIIEDNRNKKLAISSENSSSRAINRPGDEGIGWEVMSLSEYSGATTFVTLPTIQNKTNDTAGYMFYTIDTSASYPGVQDFYMDFGVAYELGGDGLVRWRVFQLRTDPEFVLEEDMYEPFDDIYIDTNRLYFRVEHLSENPGFMSFKIVDGTNFDRVFVDYHFHVGSYGIYDTNTSFNKQITLCNSNHNYLTGTRLLNAAFDNSYIYSTPNGITTKMLPENCADGEHISGNNYEPDRCGAFGTNSDNARQVIKNSGTNWHEENISIYFQQMP